MTESMGKEDRDTGSPTKWLIISSFVVLVIGCIGYFSLPRGPLSFYIFAHVGALGVLGLIGSGIGALARKKGRSYTTALLLGIPLPIVVGLIGALTIGDHVSCGGSLSLLIAIIVTIVYAFISKKTSLEAGQAG